MQVLQPGEIFNYILAILSLDWAPVFILVGTCYSDSVIPLDTMISLDKHAQWHELFIDAQTVHSYHVRHRIRMRISMRNKCRSKVYVQVLCTRRLEAGLWLFTSLKV